MNNKVEKIIDQYGTPAYVYDLHLLTKSFYRLKKILPDKSLLYYSVKANPLPEIINALMQLGCNLELSSEGEVEIAFEAGAHMQNCLVTGPCKSADYINFCLDKGIKFFSVESLTELKHLNHLTQKYKESVNIILRVNPNNATRNASMKMMGLPSQFGMDIETLVEHKGIFKDFEFLKVIGFHFYMASNISTTEGLLENYLEGITNAANLSAALNIRLEFLNLGGGFAHPYGTHAEIPSYENLKPNLENALDRNLPEWRQNYFQLVFESGRYLTGNCGKLYLKVEDIKTSKGKKFAILNGGINHLGGMAGLRKIPRFVPEVSVYKKSSEQMEEYELVGPLCTPIDKLAEKKLLPGLTEHSIVSIPNVGAYGLTASLIGFLSHPCPTEIILNNDELLGVSQLELKRKKLLI